MNRAISDSHYQIIIRVDTRLSISCCPPSHLRDDLEVLNDALLQYDADQRRCWFSRNFDADWHERQLENSNVDVVETEMGESLLQEFVDVHFDDQRSQAIIFLMELPTTIFSNNVSHRWDFVPYSVTGRISSCTIYSAQTSYCTLANNLTFFFTQSVLPLYSSEQQALYVPSVVPDSFTCRP